MGFVSSSIAVQQVTPPGTFEDLLICFYDAFEEKRVLLDVGVFGGLQLGQGQEHGAATGHIHVVHWPLERSRSQVWAKGIDYVLPVVLVKQHKRHLKNRVCYWSETQTKQLDK